MLRLFGTHGTCRSFADLIFKQGFIRGIGRHGNGIYLWSASLDNTASKTRAIELAKCYAQDSSRLYTGENDSSIRVIWCEVHTEQARYLDLELEHIHRMFIAYVDKHVDYLKNPRNGSDKERAAKVADGFVDFLEKTASTKYQVIRTRTRAPESFRSKYPRPAMFLGINEAECYIVRDNQCIPSDSLVVAA